jgi:hypothetical protein
MKDKLIIILLLLNLFSSCGEILEEAGANVGGYQLLELYGYQCITNFSSIWCN